MMAFCRSTWQAGQQEAIASLSPRNVGAGQQREDRRPSLEADAGVPWQVSLNNGPVCRTDVRGEQRCLNPLRC